MLRHQLQTVLYIITTALITKINSQNELLSKFTKTSHQLPIPTSDMTITSGIAPDNEGNINLGLYLVGGCQYGYFVNNTCAHVTDSVQIYDPHLGYFAQRSSMPSPRYNHNSVTISGLIWVIGGVTVANSLEVFVDVYQPYFDKWDRIGKLPFGRREFVLIGHEMDIFMIGGFDEGNKVTSTVFKLDTELIWNHYSEQSEKEEVEEIPVVELVNMPTARGSIKGILYGHYIYIVGGVTYNCQVLSTMEIYNVVENHWISEKISNLNNPRFHYSILKFHSNFYIFGGKSNCQDRSNEQEGIEVYDPLQGLDSQWKEVHHVTLPEIQNEPISRMTVASLVDTDELFLFGGVIYDNNCRSFDCLKFTATDEVFFLETNAHADQINSYHHLQTFVPIHIIALGIAGLMALLAVCVCKRKQYSIADDIDEWTFAVENEDEAMDSIPLQQLHQRENEEDTSNLRSSFFGHNITSSSSSADENSRESTRREYIYDDPIRDGFLY